MNILKKANEIINERSEEKEREYGPMSETNRQAAIICSVLSKRKVTTIDIYHMQISLKLAREGWSHKEDNLLDAVAYIGGLNNYLENVRNEPNDVILKDEL